MQSDFWFNCWNNNEIGFHEQAANPLLVKHIHALSLKPESRVFLPLCGKTTSIPWLRSMGYKVVGIELSQIAVEQMFDELGIDPVISKEASLLCYSTESIDIWVGDFFELTTDLLGKVDAVYDRGALVALPREMRHRYSAQLKSITENASQLLICYEYDAKLMQGPPFSITTSELKQHYGEEYLLQQLDSIESDFSSDSLIANENVWLIEA